MEKEIIRLMLHIKLLTLSKNKRNKTKTIFFIFFCDSVFQKAGTLDFSTETQISHVKLLFIGGFIKSLRPV